MKNVQPHTSYTNKMTQLSETISQYNNLRREQNALIQKRDRCFFPTERAIVQEAILSIDARIQHVRSLLRPVKLRANETKYDILE